MPSYTVLVCPTCGGKTSLSSDATSATCNYCGNEMILHPAAGSGLVYSETSRPRGEAPLPKGVKLENLDNGFEISRRWFSLKYIFMAFFCVFWDGFLIFWYSLAFSMGAPLIMKVFPILHLAVGIYLTYSTLAGFFNTSYVTVNRQEVKVEHYPLPWPGKFTLPASDLDQLYVREIIHRGKNGTTTTYTLSAMLRNGRKIDILKNMDSPEAGFYVEQQVERYLSISDQAVAGELPR